MADMQFEDQTNEFGAPPQQSAGFDLTGKLVDWGLVSSTEEAQYVLIGVAVVAFLAAAFFIFHSGGGSAPPPPPIS